jgi:hypothetical protein
MSEYLVRLKDSIRRLYGCESTHIESVPVTETFGGQTVWDGVVEVYTLVDHPKAKRCYAWSHSQGEAGERSIAVLEFPPIDSPLAAVRASIVAEQKTRPN